MFRRNPFAGKPNSPRTPISPSPATGPIPEDEVVPSTPILSSIQTAWNDPPTSWTSSTAAYDENPRYTTANNSYSHRRRKSSLITGLITRQNDPYQPTYQDWRRMTPESPRGSFSLNSGIPKEHSGDYRSRKKTKVFAWFLLVVALVFSGIWVFGGPLPLFSLDGLKNPFGGTFAGDIWPARMSKPDIDWKKYKPNINVDWNVQRLIPQKLWPGSGSEGVTEPSHFATVSSTSTTISTVHLNTDMIAFAPKTVSRVTSRAIPTPSLPPVDGDVEDGDADKRSVIPPVVKPVHIAEDSVTAVGPPVQARSETLEESKRSEEQVETAQASTSEESATPSTEEERSATGQPSHVEEMFRKHARVITPIAEETSGEEASPPADGVPVNTAVEGESGGN